MRHRVLLQELLRATEEAVGGVEMAAEHDELVKLGKEERECHHKKATTADMLEKARLALGCKARCLLRDEMAAPSGRLAAAAGLSRPAGPLQKKRIGALCR